MRWRFGFRHLQWAALAAWLGVLIGSCAHDWEQWLPAGGFTGSAAGGSGAGSVDGGGGSGGTVIVGDCPTGSSDAPPLVRAWTPDHRAICIGRTEVTRGQYETFLEAVTIAGEVGGGYEEVSACAWNINDAGVPGVVPAQDWPPNGVRLSNPIAFVDWCDALAFCMHYGQRLCGAVEGGGSVPDQDFDDPAVSEWFAACTNAGNSDFPYGNSYQSGVCRGDEPASGPAPVGSLTGCRSTAGVYDLSGNLWEWENACVGSGTQNDQCRQRGGGYQTAPSELSCSAQSTAERREPAVVVGFRCCADSIQGEGGSGAAGGTGTGTGTPTGTPTGTGTATDAG